MGVILGSGVMRRTRRVALAAFGGAALAAAAFVGAGQAEDFVILDSSAAGVEPGVVMGPDQQITVPAGAEVVILGPLGETLVVVGPYSGVVGATAAAASGGAAEALDKITSSRGGEATVLGAVRAPGLEAGAAAE